MPTVPLNYNPHAVKPRRGGFCISRLHCLEGRSLLTAEAGDRWSLHPLLRDYTRALGPVDRASWQRMARHYEGVARAADDLYLQGGDDTLYGPALFDTDWPHIRAGQAWAADHTAEGDEAARLCSDYPDAGAYLLNLRLHPREQIAWLQAAAAAVHLLGDKEAEGNHQGNLGNAYCAHGEVGRGIEYYKDALAIARDIGDLRAEGTALGNLGTAYRLFREPRQATEYYQDALAIVRAIGDRRMEGNLLGGLSTAHLALGEPRQAIEHHEQALAISKEVGDRRAEAVLLVNLGLLTEQQGDPASTRALWNWALAIYEAIEDPRAEEVRSLIAELSE